MLTGHSRWSDEVFRILGLDPASGSLSRQDFVERIVHPEDRGYAIQRYDQVVHGGKLYDLEYRVIRPDGSVRFVQSMGEPIRNTDGAVVRLVGALLDITERKQAEEALREAQAELAHVTRVATLGEMTASIAHEINQPLAAVVNNASACLRWLAAQQPGGGPAVCRAGHRRRPSSRRNHRSDSCARQESSAAEDWLDINETILEVIALARSEVHRNRVSLRLNSSSDVPLILGDRIQLQQVILNLIINAIEAMSGVSEGPRELLVASGKMNRRGVLVTVRDSGPGLGSEKSRPTLQCLLYNEASRHGHGAGDQPLDYRGPRRAAVGDRQREQRRDVSVHVTRWGREGLMTEADTTVFVVDDDPPMREALKNLLGSVRLRVEAFASAQEFLRSRRSDVPGCLVLDVRMPGLSGLDLQKRLVRPGRRFPLSSSPATAIFR